MIGTMTYIFCIVKEGGKGTSIETWCKKRITKKSNKYVYKSNLSFSCNHNHIFDWSIFTYTKLVLIGNVDILKSLMYE